MSLLRKLGRWLLIGSAALVMALIAVAALATVWLHSSLPQTRGRLVLADLGQPVFVTRDRDGIPHIAAQSEDDAYRALGFLHAQDRLWQMEMTRRAGAGRLSEVLGPPLLSIDKFIRTLGLHARAVAIFARAPAELRAALDAYAQGVNAFLDTHQGAWPAEYYLLHFRPEPWRPTDSLVWGQLMGLRLAGDWRDELTRTGLADRLTPQQISALLDEGGASGPVTVEDSPRRADTDAPARGEHSTVAVDPHVAAHLLALLPSWLGPTSASNSWILAGERTTSGKPLLANDPHLAFEAPNTWYLARLTAPGLELAGATAPGVPFHVLGHNGRIAWGLTNTGSDVQDLFIERLDPGDPERYLTANGSLAFATRQERIKVRDGDDVVITIRETRHGVVVSDLTEGPQRVTAGGQVLAFASAGFRPDDQSAEALYRLNRAGNWAQFTEALRRFHYPQQNIAYADVAGNIGFYVAGRVPIRKRGDGAQPVPGWSGDYDWLGFVPFEELPHSVNPASGRLFNANNRVIGPNYPYPLGRDWAEPYRARRIEALIESHPRHDGPQMSRMQADIESLTANELLPLMLPAARALPSPSPLARAATDLLATWDGRMARDLPQPLLFNAWLRALNRAIYADELGPDFARLSWSSRPAFIARVLSRDPAWCDDTTTPEREGCDGRIQAAFTAALDSLSAAFGSDPRRWRWGDAHRLRFAHRVLSRVPLIGPWTDVEIETPGDDSTINRGTARQRDGTLLFPHVHGANLRAIYDLADLDNARFIIAGGQSGNRLSPFYANMLARWRDADYVTLGAPRSGGDRLILVPKGNAR